MATSNVNSTSYFNGSSTYAAQLQQTIKQAVNIASLPVKQLQTQQATSEGEQAELQNVTSSFSAMQAAISALGSSTGVGAFSATVSQSSIASASISSGVMAGNYSLNVISIGSQTNTISQNGGPVVIDPSVSNISSSRSYTLSLNGASYSISDPGGTLNGLAQAINSSSANVQASVVNFGSSGSPDYRLSVQSLSYSPDTIQLNDGTSDLLSTLSTGSNVTYQINGQPSTAINSSSRSVVVSPGLSVQLLQTGTTQITVAQSASNMESALSAFASAYNSIVAELDKNRGQNGGALTGNSIIYELQNQLQSLANYSPGSGSIGSLADLGLSFDDSGDLQFDAASFNQTAGTSPNDLLNFIGSSTSGGFLEAANNMLTAVTDPTSGILTGASNDLTSEIASIGTKITGDQSQVSQLQQSLTTQMAKVDSTISSLQSQLTEITDLFSQMQTNQRADSGY
ncbi:MAG: flagellar filament capping protein FliD [Acidobacteriaceae bacterium]|nr:flagellar filament capping protein FliD [Acidobacteriaceae bacterium]